MEDKPRLPRQRNHAPTIIDVARAAGVSKSTVSNVLQGKQTVAEDLRERVLSAMQDLNYQTHVGARALRQQSRVLGVVVGDLTNPFHAELAALVEDHAARRQYSVLLTTTSGVAEREADRVRSLLEHRVAALLFLSAPHREARSILDRSTPVVLASITGRGLAWVAVNEAAGTRAAVAHLAGLGHRRIGFVSAMLDDEPSAETARYQGFAQGMKESGLPVAARHLLRPTDGHREGRAWFEEFRKYVTQRDRPTAVVAAHDFMALELLAAAEAEGIVVPRDLSIVGFDDISIARWSRVALTTVSQPMDEIARRAVDLAIDAAIEGTQPTQHVRLEPSLVIRGTTASPLRTR